MIEAHHDDFSMIGNNETDVFDEQTRALIESLFKPKTVEKDMFFLKQGEPSTQMALVNKGLFRSYYIDENGNDITKFFYPEGAKLFSYKAYIHHENSTYSIQALETSDILTANIADFELAAKNNSQLLWYYKKTLDEMLLMKDELTYQLKVLSSTERYRAFLALFPGLERRVKQYQIASFLGITPVSLSRIKNKTNINK